MKPSLFAVLRWEDKAFGMGSMSLTAQVSTVLAFIKVKMDGPSQTALDIMIQNSTCQWVMFDKDFFHNDFS